MLVLLLCKFYYLFINVKQIRPGGFQGMQMGGYAQPDPPMVPEEEEKGK